MRRFYTEKTNISGDLVELDKDERNHLANVLRLKEGERVVVFCNDGFDYISEVSEIGKYGVKLKIIERFENLSEPKIKFTLFQGVAKGDKMEFIIQKAEELGASELIPFTSRFTVATEAKIKVERLSKIAIEAAKQCKRSNVITICECISFKKMLEIVKAYDAVIFANEREDATSVYKTLSGIKNRADLKSVAIVVGSEGGFSDDEIESLSKIAFSVSLGKRILRCETAAVALLSFVSFFFEV